MIQLKWIFKHLKHRLYVPHPRGGYSLTEWMEMEWNRTK